MTSKGKMNSFKEGTLFAKIISCLLKEPTTAMHSERIINMPLDIIWTYGFFNIDLAWTTNLPKVLSINMYDVFEISEYIDEHGLDPIELTLVGNKGLITDGNHRVMAARRLGYSQVPVKVVVILDPINSPLYNHPDFKVLDSSIENEIKKGFLTTKEKAY